MKQRCNFIICSMARPLSQYWVRVSTPSVVYMNQGPTVPDTVAFRLVDKIVAPSSRKLLPAKFSVRNFVKDGRTSTNSLMWIADQPTHENLSLFLSTLISRKVFCGSFASVLRSVHAQISLLLIAQCRMRDSSQNRVVLCSDPYEPGSSCLFGKGIR